MKENTKAFLDTNILMGGLSSDLVLSSAEEPDYLYIPLWNSHVIKELRRHLPAKILEKHGDWNPQTATSSAEHRIRAMMRTFPGSMVNGWDAFMEEASGFVRDPDDTEILAGAIAGGADVLVTENVSDFNAKAIESSYGIETIRESAFLIEMLHSDPSKMRRNLIRMVSGHGKPPTNLMELCRRLSEIPELSGFGQALEDRIRREYDMNVSMMFHRNGSGVQPRDRLGRFGRKTYPVSFDVLPPGTGYWGPDGNGPEF